MKDTAIDPGKNLHASIPAALLAEAGTAAKAEQITMDESVRDAVERRLRQRRRDSLYAYGEEQARKLGIKEEDVDRIIHEFREEERERQSREQGTSRAERYCGHQYLCLSFAVRRRATALPEGRRGRRVPVGHFRSYPGGDAPGSTL